MSETKEKTTKETNEGRRGFLNQLWLLLSAIGFAEFFWIAITVLNSHKSQLKADHAATIIAAGKVDDFKPNSVTAFQRGRFYLARLDDGGFLALSRQCTHLGCTVPWVEKEKKFACPCHGSAFDITGGVLNPPASRALDLYPLVIENNFIRVDTSRRIKRSQFRSEQIVYPDMA